MISKSRKTKETDITISLLLNGEGKAKIQTGVGFLDHMLESFSKHSLIDLEISCKGDTQIDDHHSVEDVGIVLGSLLSEAIYPVKNMERFGSANIVMDEACVSCDLDLSNRPYLVYDIDVTGKIGQFDTELVEEFFKAFISNARISAHIVALRGKNRHHIVEAAFKSLAVAIRRAIQKNDRVGIPSTKDML
ncbi:imidazoleglycerol-phosphate dehydratase HisB [Sulfurimonas sp.]|jgi:imidazoleglycerol-phosphate dehydratase|uniref:imidazoleglycerol-phosphate dehydratase HisB n=1 Tax=Sulfurimonas sp. TaxID=2022749 RepID=UPI0025D42F43|nr:imidazoleglycerol-phosphate dehydratase HisB [Sulfurimonas sp.]MCK9472444.1 imidazoleglycerol-phosphate dehydratase HisB [Sulfurimonas sp.]MDD3505934.1 imidazoleglycerol-phosphate dehydratase HisB [Sulfurimonas sp.]